jgi:hypothetical protein
LHSNYYHAFLREATFKAHAEDAKKFMKYLSRKLDEAERSGSSI